MPSDMVDHPAHYQAPNDPEGLYEARVVTREWGLNHALASAVEYIARADRKGDPVTDLKKAINWLQFEISNRRDAQT